MKARDDLYEEIMIKGWNKEKQFFGQSYEDLDVIDASLLVMPLVFFVVRSSVYTSVNLLTLLTDRETRLRLSPASYRR